MTVRRVKAETAKEMPDHFADPAPGMLHQIPALVAHCSMVKYPDGEPRMPGRFAVFVDGAEWCVRVSDPDSLMSFTAKAPSVSDALLLAELWYTGDKCPWAPDSYMRELAARKKKK